VLTNRTPVTAAAALANAGMTEYVDVVLSVDAVRIYKPSPRVYAMVPLHFGCAPADCILVTANGWDGTGAAEYGLGVAWCNRLGAPAETFGSPPSLTVHGLAELVPALRVAGAR
jgi:2-haloacid dehalogenase